MENISVVEVNFYKDEEELSPTKGMYWVVIRYNNNTEESEFFTEEEVKELIKFIEMEGYTGHIPLHEWIKKKRPAFFSRAITDSDPNGIVIQLLRKLEDHFQVND